MTFVSRLQDSNYCVETDCGNTIGHLSPYWCDKCYQKIEKARNGEYLTKFYDGVDRSGHSDKKSMENFLAYLDQHKLLVEWEFYLEKNWRIGCKDKYMLEAHHEHGWGERDGYPCYDKFLLEAYTTEWKHKIELQDDSILWVPTLVRYQVRVEKQQELLDQIKRERKHDSRRDLEIQREKAEEGYSSFWFWR